MRLSNKGIREWYHAVALHVCVCERAFACVCSDMYGLRTGELVSPGFRISWKARVLGYVIVRTRGLTSCL